MNNNNKNERETKKAARNRRNNRKQCKRECDEWPNIFGVFKRLYRFINSGIHSMGYSWRMVFLSACFITFNIRDMVASVAAALLLTKIGEMQLNIFSFLPLGYERGTDARHLFGVTKTNQFKLCNMCKCTCLK